MEQEEYKRFEESEAREMLERKARQQSEQKTLHDEKEQLAETLKVLHTKRVALEAELSQLSFELEKAAKIKSQEGTT